jgi:hypothetical protein
VIVIGLLLGVAGIFGVVWTTFLISRTLNAAYGRADGGLSARAANDGSVPAKLRWLLRAFALLAVIGAGMVIAWLYR